MIPMKPSRAVAPAEDAVPASSKPSEVAPAGGKIDVVVVHGVTEDGRGLQVIRHRNDRIEAGAVHALAEGKPIHGEVVRLRPRKHCPLVCDVDVELPQQASFDPAAHTHPQREQKGPAQVASDRYRSNWDAIWKGARKSRLVN